MFVDLLLIDFDVFKPHSLMRSSFQAISLKSFFFHLVCWLQWNGLQKYFFFDRNLRKTGKFERLFRIFFSEKITRLEKRLNCFIKKKKKDRKRDKKRIFSPKSVRNEELNRMREPFRMSETDLCFFSTFFSLLFHTFTIFFLL